MSLVLFRKENNIGIIILNRPDKYNAFNREMALLLQGKLDDCTNDDDIRSIYISGAGKAFCSGQDLSEITGENAPGFEQILSEHYNPIITRLREIPKPIVVAVNGIAAGAGANIALCGDVVVAAEGAAFIQAFSKIGLVPDSGGTFILPRLVGWQKASAIMMLGDKVTAIEAERMGMIYKTLPNENFEEASLQIAATLASMPTKGLALTKQALNASLGNTLEQQLQLEDQLQYAAAHTYDFEEGIRAFMEKRPPVFVGK